MILLKSNLGVNSIKKSASKDAPPKSEKYEKSIKA